MTTLYVVSFIDFQPPPKYDGHPWTQIKIEESADPVNGPWNQIDLLTISTPDADPSDPQLRSFTTSLGTIPEGWYKVTFLDAFNAQAQSSDPVQNIADETAVYLPTVHELAILMRARTKDSTGNELGVFSADTRPMAEEARRAIQEAADDVTGPIDTVIPPRAYRFVKNAILYRAAMIIEVSFFPEQIGTGRSPFESYKQLFDEAAGNLVKAVERERSEQETGDQPGLDPTLTRYEFPPVRGWDTKIW